MAFTQADLDVVNKAISSGELRININGEDITYRSISELLKARNTIRAELDDATGIRRRRSVATQYNKGV